MKVIVKIGGAALETADTLNQCAASVAELVSTGHQVAVVHGGGVAVTRVLLQMGITSEFVQGVRVTDQKIRDVALMVLAGLVNKKLVAALTASGCRAIGLCGADGGIFRAQKREMAGVDLGFVGEIVTADSTWLDVIWSAGGIPVITSLALGIDGEYYNINADEMAAACATAVNADALIFLTDVAGVKDDRGNVMSSLNVADLPRLIETSVIKGGMLPKLQACTQALSGGVQRVHILPALHADVLNQFHSSHVALGTEVTQ